MGTLEPAWVTSMRLAGAAASRRGTPVVFDPVARAPPLPHRDGPRLGARADDHGRAGQRLRDPQPRWRGGDHQGVDAVHAVGDAAREAGELAVAFKTTLAVTGAVDLVTDGRTTLQIEGGSRLMGRVTGTGCMATAIVAAFCAVEKDPVAAAAGGLALLKLAAERARSGRCSRLLRGGATRCAVRARPGDLARTDRVREVRP